MEKQKQTKKKYPECPYCHSDELRRARVSNYWYWHCWKCNKDFDNLRIFELKDIEPQVDGKTKAN